MGQLRQLNRGDIYGELWETFNIDLTSSPGKLKTSRRLGKVLDGATHLTNPAAVLDLVVWNGKYYVFTDEGAFYCSLNDDPRVPGNWSKDTNFTSNPSSFSSTVAVFGGNLLLSLGTNIALYNGTTFTNNWWTATVGGAGLANLRPHVLHVHRGGQETVFVTDGNLVRYYNAAAGHSSLSLQTDLTACCIDSGVSAIWVGTFNATSGNAYVYEVYVGETLTAGVAVSRNAYQVDGRGVLALWVKDNIPYIVTDRGRIQAFNGAGFTNIAEFPFAFSGFALDGVSPGLIQDAPNSRPINPRGVKVHNDSVYILLNAESDNDDFPPTTRTHSGVWEYNYTTGVLNHRFGVAETDTSFGASTLERPGPILILDNAATFLMAGAVTKSSVGLYMTTTGPNQAWFITPEFGSDTIQDSFQRVIHKAKTLGPTDAIHTLYRKSKRDTIYLTVNWVNGTSFTTTNGDPNLAEGDLIRIAYGASAGEWANIVQIEDGTLTRTITVNRSIGVENQTSYAYSDNFRLLKELYTVDDGEYKAIGVNVVNPWIQFMVVMKGMIEYRSFESVDGPKTQRG